jgi:ubiquitin-protein ligase E3 C
MPLESIFSLAASPNFVNQIERMSTDDAVQLSANLAAFASKKINHFTNSRGVKEYLEVMQMLLDIIPIELLREKVVEADIKGKAKEIIIIDSDDEDDEENGVALVTGKDKDGDSKMDLSTSKLPTATTIDPRTISFLAYLPAREHLVSLLNLSSRYSATTRPALAAFLVSLLASWSRKREEVLNTVMFGITSSSDSGTVGERGGGLLREIWRGYIRSSRLGKLLLATNVDRSSSSLLPILLDPCLRTEWPCFILLAELYSRCLLTLGDDEFYSAKNPLTLDEVVGFSAILRNLAFALYWQEGGSTAKNDMNNREGWEGLKVIGTRIKVIELRSLAVTLLNQIHARE